MLLALLKSTNSIWKALSLVELLNRRQWFQPTETVQIPGKAAQKGGADIGDVKDDVDGDGGHVIGDGGDV